jgi:hypothetical protein
LNGEQATVKMNALSRTPTRPPHFRQRNRFEEITDEAAHILSKLSGDYLSLDSLTTLSGAAAA